MPTILEVRNIAKKFGKISALVDIDFKIDEGEFVYITGSSGAGKTTLLKCILRQILPDSGEIILEGVDIAKLPRKKIPQIRQQIGVVFQDFKVLPERTVRENVEVALAVIGLKKSEWNARVDHVLLLVGLFERSELFPSQLSGGELQRVSLARALVVNPKIILADEPTGNLDWETADKIMDLFNLINREGKTILMATHNMQVVEKHKRRIIEIKDGLVFKDTANPESSSDNKGELSPEKNFETQAVSSQDIETAQNQESIDIQSKEKGEDGNKPAAPLPSDDTPIHPQHSKPDFEFVDPQKEKIKRKVEKHRKKKGKKAKKELS